MNEELLKEIDEITKEIEESSSSYQALQATIAGDLEKISKTWKSLRKKRSELAIQFIDDENLLDMLLDVETAKIIYDLGWDNGLGVRDFEKTIDKHVKIPYLSFEFGGWYSRDEYTVRVPDLIVPLKCDEDKLMECAEALKKLFVSYIELSGEDEFGVGIMENTLSEYGGFSLVYDSRTNEYYVGKTTYGSPQEISERGALIETLKYISENVYCSDF